MGYGVNRGAESLEGAVDSPGVYRGVVDPNTDILGISGSPYLATAWPPTIKKRTLPAAKLDSSSIKSELTCLEPMTQMKVDKEIPGGFPVNPVCGMPPVLDLKAAVGIRE